MERFFSRLIIVITLLTISTNLSAQTETEIQRKFFNKLELGKYVSKKMIASSIGVPEYMIRKVKISEGTKYTVHFPIHFGGEEWTSIQITAVNDKIALISFVNIDDYDNKDIYDNLLEKLTQKYGQPDNEDGLNCWYSTYLGIGLIYVSPSAADDKYLTILNYLDYKLFEKGESKALEEL